MMFDDSPRATKRQKTNTYNQTIANTTPSKASAVRSSGKSKSQSVVTYSSRRKQGHDTSETQDSSKNNEPQQDGSTGSDVVDSAYHSMTTTHEEASEDEGPVVNETPSGRRSRRLAVAQEPPSTLESIAVADNTSSNQSNGANEEEAHSPRVRTSGRARKKTWKHTEVEQAAEAKRARSVSSRAPSAIPQEQVLPKDSLVPQALPLGSTPRKKTSPKRTLPGSAKRGRPRKYALPVPETLNDRIALKTRKSEAQKQDSSRGSNHEEENSEVETASKPLTPNQGKRLRAAPSRARLDDSTSLDQSSVLAKTTEEEKARSSAHLLDLLREKRYAELFVPLKQHILACLAGKQRLPPVEQEVEYQKVSQVVEQTIVAGEGNSMLVIGARGTGKTNLVEMVISTMANDHGDDFHVIRLDGFIHTDDKIALRETWRQLGREMEIDDGQMGIRSNYADTLASLLALLSHPAELSSLDGEARQTSKAVVFILNEFDLFTSHPRQTLLYNLFDIAQSRKAPITVLGLTTKIDVVESLEKRVKSRFSHRYVHLSLAKTYPVFVKICKTALLAQPLEGTSLDVIPLPDLPRSKVSDFIDLHVAWCAYISSVISDSALNTLLRMIYYQSKSVPTFLSAAILPIASMCPTSIPTALDFVSDTLTPPDSKLHLLPSLSEMELSLLIAATRLDIILDTDTCNFNMAYDEYCSLIDRLKTQSSISGLTAVGGNTKLREKEIALEAWERLEELELLIPVTGPGGGGNMDVGGRGKLCKVDVALEDIRDSGVEMNAVLLSWCKSI